MTVYLPDTLSGALSVLQENPAADILAGGTDLMTELNYRHRAMGSVLCLRNLSELGQWDSDGQSLTIGANVKYSDIMTSDIARLAPALAQAARTVGSPQIRNTGTLGGNLATASPAGDTLPVLYALEANVNLRSTQGDRTVPVQDFITGVKRNALRPGELIVSVTMPVAKGRQEFLKIGKRNAMVIAVTNLALVVNEETRKLTCALGAVGPSIIRCTDAEDYINGQIDWSSGVLPDRSAVSRFAELCGAAARPIDDHRSTANYRRHAVAILAKRALDRVV
ncbi:FAD binding domain-containing protein [Ruegeria atlantica]|uniref:FAD binding domain-containing protein n=1 Tax=Ruegeria atlantica TaxID=81569 RepID=UPI0014818A7C|nr:FAD binding domain-containing protein [Ruegeria atlantica]